MSAQPLSHYTKKLIAKEPFSDDDVNGLLKAYHAVHTGSTFAEYGKYPTDKGVTSYELLAHTVQIDHHPTRIVDLACGDGPLAEILLNRFHDQIEIVALDMSEGELNAAKERLQAFSNVQLVLGKADAIPSESGSVDYVLCHLALFLMRPIEAVFAEVGRVLKPGGIFSAIVGQNDGIANEIASRCLAILKEVNAEYIPHFLDIGLGIKATYTKDGLNTLAAATNCFKPPEYDDFNVIVTATPQQHFELFSTVYAPPLLPPEGKEKLKQKLLGYLESLKDENNQVTIYKPLRKVTIQKI